MNITIDDFKKLEIKIGKVILAERIPGADKLLRIVCDIGPSTRSPLRSASSEGQAGQSPLDTSTSENVQPTLSPPTQTEHKTVQILSGIAEWYDPATLVDKEIPLLLNLDPRTMRGLVSYGMMLTADADGKPTLLHPATEVPPGSIVK